ncbi:MAG TPA: aldo/keto reductase [Chloroflexota bacterium]|nr:aldo/keto reductase [Chloroflexota bacterium]
MEYRRMGSSELTVSAIGFGCWELGGTNYGPIDEAAAVAAIHRAIDLGVTLIDTAPGYGFGHSEEVLGRALGARRKDVVLVSKTAIHWDPVTFTRKMDSRYSTVKRINEESLKRLGTDYLDLLLIHWPDVETPLEETMRALNDLVKEGKARYIGVSNFTAYELRESKQHAPICANQVGYNLFDRRWEREMFPTAQELGIGVMAYGPMAHGLLTGTMGRGTTFQPTDWRSSGLLFGQSLFGAEHLAQNLEVVERLKEIAARVGTTLPRLALAWVLRHPAVAVALSGCRTVGEIEENVRALEVKLSEAMLGEIDEVMAGAAGQVEEVPGQHHLPGVTRGVGTITGTVAR